MLQPKRTKFRKAHKGRIRGMAKGGAELNFGAFGMKATDRGRVTARQIEAARRAITRHLKRAGRVWIRIFPDMPVSKKPAEVRMGKGKGSVEYWVAPVKPGRIMFEIDGVPARARRGGDPAGVRQAADADALRAACARGGGAMKAERSAGQDGRRAAGRRCWQLKKEQFNLRFQRATGQLENTARLKRRCAATSPGSRRCCMSGGERRPRRA